MLIYGDYVSKWVLDTSDAHVLAGNQGNNKRAKNAFLVFFDLTLDSLTII